MTKEQRSAGAVDGKSFVVGVDVGTGSARAGLFDASGDMLASAKRAITVFHAPGAIVEQSSNEIWSAVCHVVKETLSLAKVTPAQIAGIGFDATCSLVIVGQGGEPLPVGSCEHAQRNIMVWMDHRAVEQAQRINHKGHMVLKYVGGKISPEMETPKLLWLKEHRPQIFKSVWQFFDLADFLTWRATGDLARSTCTVTCKWTYLAHEQRWDASYFQSIGLGELADESFARIGQVVVEPGTALGNGLTERAAAELGLHPGTPVAAGIIDAHAGGIGTVGADGAPQSCLAYVFGTSSCTMTTTPKPVFVPGVWGPYFSAMVPNAWLNEGGQSAAGAAIEHLLCMHPAAWQARQRAELSGHSLPGLLTDIALHVSHQLSDAVNLAHGLHVVPEFLGNRAPFADPHARALIAGLGMDDSVESLAALYIAGICSLGYGLRQIIEAQALAGAPVERVVLSGGAGRHALVRQLLADTSRVPLVTTQAQEPVLLGAAMLGSVAGKLSFDVPSAMVQMSKIDKTYRPCTGKLAALHDQRYLAFQRLQDVGRAIR